MDVILTNPPFGGEEKKENQGNQGNFPEDRQISETALLFLQLIMRKLKRQPTAVGRPARAAVVGPNGTLFGDGVCARIKEELYKEFNLHTDRPFAEWRILHPTQPIPTKPALLRPLWPHQQMSGITSIRFLKGEKTIRKRSQIQV